MEANETKQIKNIGIQGFVRDFKELTKAGLAFSVVFSTLAGYLLAIPAFTFDSLKTLILLSIGGYCMVGASNAYNQIIEVDTDRLMNRTKNRPLVAGRVSKNYVFVLATLLTLLGLIILYTISPKTAMFGALSIFLYTCVYTPLKPITPLSVFVGAFPGAIPFMLGWVAHTNSFGIEAGTLFMIQFFWQFPHFWALGWFLYDDYKRGGFAMLPSGKKDNKTILQIILYSLWLNIAAIIPVFGFTGQLRLSLVAAILVGLSGLWLLWTAFELHKKRTDKIAKKLMLVSVTYISLIQIIYVIDKFIR